MIAQLLFAVLIGSVADLPLTTPAGWTATKDQGATVYTPNDVPTGKFFTVLATPLTGKAGTLDSVYETGKTMLAEVGKYTALATPPVQKSEGGWDYKFSVGSLEKDGKQLLAQVTGAKKGDEGGTIIVLAESLETMQKYGDAIGHMLRTLGGAAKPPPTPKVESVPGEVDLQFQTPSGWTVTKKKGVTVVEAAKEDFYTNYRWSLLVLPTQTLDGPLRDAFREYWNALIAGPYETKVAPLPLMTRLGSGALIAFDGDGSAVNKSNGSRPHQVGVFLLAQGNKFTPIMVLLYGFEKKLETDVAQFLNSARIPNASGAATPVYEKSKLIGNWHEGSSSFANYVTSSGAYAGDASIYTGSYLDLKSDGTFSRTFIGITSTTRLKESDTGKWSLDGDELLLTKSKGGVDRYSLHGYGDDPKAGRFLVLGTYANRPSTISFTNPRGPFQASWYKVK